MYLSVPVLGLMGLLANSISLLPESCAFALHKSTPRQQTTLLFYNSQRTTAQLLRAADRNENQGCPKGEADASDTEIREMDNLILSLSRETSDEKRRKRVDKVLQENLASKGVDFERLFSDRLTIVGNDIRSQAAAVAQKAAGEADNACQASNEASQVSPSSSEEFGKQVWALVDMLVQSKVIFKQQQAKKEGM